MFRLILQPFMQKKGLKQSVLLVLSCMIMPAVWAAGPPVKSSMSNPLVLSFVILILLLLLVIAILANVLLGAAIFQRDNEKKAASKVGVTAMTIGLLCISGSLYAQDASTTAPIVETLGNIPPTTFYFIMGVLGVEVLVIFFMLFQVRAILAKQKKQKVIESLEDGAIEAKPSMSWWDKFNSFRPAEQEAEIDLGHEYDGIRELDNRLPPWWLYGFYITIVFAGIYLYRYHVAHSAPLSAEELVIATKKAEQQQAEYLKTAANLVDESTVKVLTDAGEIAGGKGLFDQNCVACHGKAGEGGVGPNLTDAYWIHGGSIQDIFKTIKYGWQEKGMKSWKEDFTASQMAQLASYITTLKGTNPANAKAPQGDLYKEAATNTAKATDSVAVK